GGAAIQRHRRAHRELPDWGISRLCQRSRARADRSRTVSAAGLGGGWAGRAPAGIPRAVSFATKPQLAQRMIERAIAAGVPFAWVVGDEVYGSDRRLSVFFQNT